MKHMDHVHVPRTCQMHVSVRIVPGLAPTQHGMLTSESHQQIRTYFTHPKAFIRPRLTHTKKSVQKRYKINLYGSSKLYPTYSTYEPTSHGLPLMFTLVLMTVKAVERTTTAS